MYIVFNYKKFPILSVQIKTFSLTFLTCLLVCDLSKVSPLIAFWHEMHVQISFFLYRHLEQKLHDHLFHANFRINPFPQCLCGFLQCGIKGWGAASRTGRGTHEKPAVTLKINGSGELSSSSHRVSPISFTFKATMGLLMVVFQSALS